MISKVYIAKRKAAKRLEVPNHPEPPRVISDRPIPVEARGGTRKFTHFYPFEEMKPGDSFWVPSGTQCTAGAISKFAKKSGWRFTSRGQAEDGRANGQISGTRAERGTRVWRVK